MITISFPVTPAPITFPKTVVPFWDSLVSQMVKNLPTMWETWVRSPGWEDPLEKGTAASPVIWPEESHGLYNLWGCKESDATEHLSLSLSLLLR